MSTLHPLVVHFPIALAVLWPIADALGLFLKRRELSRVALAMLILATLFSLAAVATGQAAFDAAVELGADPKVLNTHADNGNLVPWAMLALVFARVVGVLKLEARGHVLAVILGFCLFPLIYAVGESGGALVFEHGIGVKARGSGARSAASPEVDARGAAR